MSSNKKQTLRKLREKQNITEILIIRQVCHHMLFNIVKCLLVPVDFDLSESHSSSQAQTTYISCTVIVKKVSFVMRHRDMAHFASFISLSINGWKSNWKQPNYLKLFQKYS